MDAELEPGVSGCQESAAEGHHLELSAPIPVDIDPSVEERPDNTERFDVRLVGVAAEGLLRDGLAPRHVSCV